MGFFDRFKPDPFKPYRNPALDRIYNLLFCDDPALYQQDAPTTAYPWTVLLAPTPDPAALQALAADPTQEGRARLLAYRQLAQLGAPPAPPELLGVVVEVGLPLGLDALAAFADGSARYFNQAGKLLVWEAQTPESDELVRQLFAASRRVVSQIGPWREKRLPPPTNGLVRLTFLVADGLYFGQGPLAVFAHDAMAGPVVAAATQLLTYLTEQPAPAGG